MGQEYILQPQLFESHVSFLSSNSMTAKSIDTNTMFASAVSASHVYSTDFSSGVPGVSSIFTGVFYGWGWELEGVDKGQPGVNTWVRANSSIATGFTTLSAKSVYGDFLGTTRFRAQSANVITTNTALGSSTFHGVYYGDGWNLQGVDRGQPGVNAWVRANSSVATGFTTLCAKSVHGDFIGTTRYKTEAPSVILTNTTLGSSTFHGVFYGDGRNLLGVSFDQPEINAWVRSNSAVETLGSFWIDASAGSVALAQEWSKTAYGNGRFVSICYNTELDNIAISVDGKNWNTVTCPVTALTDVVYGNGLFVAVADSTAPIPTKQVATSIDGVNWVSNTCYSANWKSIAYGNGYFVTISDDGYAYWSNDGVTWQDVGGLSLNWKKVFYCEKSFVVVGNDISGTDIITYIVTIDTPTVRGTPPYVANILSLITPWYNNNIAYGNGAYILTTDEVTDQFYRSTDGINWVQYTLPAVHGKKRYSYSDGLFILAAEKTTPGSTIYLSKDGVSWSEKYQTGSSSSIINSLDSGNGIFTASSRNKIFVTGSIRTPNEPVINLRHGDTYQYGNQLVSGKLSVANLSANSSSVSFVVENGGELQKRFLDYSIIPQYTFTKDLSVSLGGGKTFGRYVNGNVIASTGKTIPEVLEMSLIEPITPDASVSSSTTVSFAQTSLTNNLTLTHKICSLGANVNIAGLTKLEYSRDNSVWSTLSTFNATPNTPAIYTHSFTDPLTFSGATILAGTDVKPYYYRYTVTDTAGATRTASTSITPATYQKASITPTAVTTTRYKGDVATTYSGSLARLNTVNVPLSTWQIQRNVNSGGFTNRSSVFYFGSNTTSPSAITFTDNDISIVNASSVAYQLVYTDQYLTTKGFSPQIATNSTTSTVNFVHKNVFFASSAASVTVADIDAIVTTGTSTVSGAFLVHPASKSRTINIVNTGSNQYLYYAYDSALGNITSVMQNVFTDVTTAFTQLGDVTGSNSYGAAVSYRVYRSNIQGPYSSSQPSLTFS